MSSINRDQINFINDLCESISKGVNYKAVLYMGGLYIFADDTVFYFVDLTTKFLDEEYSFYRVGSSKYPLDENTKVNIVHKYYELKSLMTNKFYENLSILEDEKFNQLVNAKTTDGAGFYFINSFDKENIFIPVFNGLPSLNKKDTVALEIFDIGNHKFLVKMTVFKKKYNLSYELIYKILNVNRPLR